MHATIDAQFTVSIDETKTLPLASLADRLTDLQLESMILEEIVNSLDEAIVETYCGEKHAAGNGERRFQRAGTTTRTAVTTAGEHEFTLHHVEDTDASADEMAYFRPIENLLQFDGQRIYQEGISLQATEDATTLSLRDAVAHGDGFAPSRSTISRRLSEAGSRLREFVRDQLPETDADVVIPDGTKVHSQDEDSSLHDVNVTLGRTAEGDEADTTLLDVAVEESWTETATRVDEAVSEDAVVVSDAEEALVEAFDGDNRNHQLDLVHVGRTLGYKLWEDDAFPLTERKAIVSSVTDDLFHLKDSVEFHAPKEEFGAIKERIDQTVENLSKEAWRLQRQNSLKAAAYLRKWQEATATFAELAIEQREVPWTSNVVERAMGEISKRCKNQWMSWSKEGLEALLWLNLVKYADSDRFESFVDEFLERTTKTAINMEVSIDGTRGTL